MPIGNVWIWLSSQSIFMAFGFQLRAVTKLIGTQTVFTFVSSSCVGIGSTTDSFKSRHQRSISTDDFPSCTGSLTASLLAEIWLLISYRLVGRIFHKRKVPSWYLWIAKDIVKDYFSSCIDLWVASPLTVRWLLILYRLIDDAIVDRNMTSHLLLAHGQHLSQKRDDVMVHVDSSR